MKALTPIPFFVPASWFPPVVEQPDGGLAMVAGDGYELVQDPTLLHALRLHISWPNSFHHFLETCSGHQGLLVFGNTLYEAPMTRSVTNSMRQFEYLICRGFCCSIVYLGLTHKPKPDQKEGDALETIAAFLRRVFPELRVLPDLARSARSPRERLLIHNVIRQARVTIAGKDVSLALIAKFVYAFDAYLDANHYSEMLKGLPSFISRYEKQLQHRGFSIDRDCPHACSQVRTVASLRKRAGRPRLKFKLDDDEFAKRLDPSFSESRPASNRLLPFTNKVLKEVDAYGGPVFIRCRNAEFFWVVDSRELERRLHMSPTDLYNITGKRSKAALLLTEIRIPPQISRGHLRVTTVTDPHETDLIFFRPGSRPPDGWGRALWFTQEGDGLPEALHDSTAAYRDCEYRMLGRSAFQKEASPQYFRDVLAFSQRQTRNLWR